MAYEINYDDKRFTEVEADKKAALSENEKVYGGIINNADKYYQDQIDASKDWAEKEKELQQQQTDFAIQKVEQQKDQTKKDYTKEQSGAYVDWQKQSNKYGANSEQMASQGLQNTGFSESSQVSMYNTYQNRVATAREAYTRAVQNYDNAITEARLQNNSALAEIAYKALQQQLELSLQGFQYKNQLLLEQANKKFQIESEYHNRYMDVLNQINTENALAEEVRQFNEQLAEQQRQFNYHNKLGEFAKSSSGGSTGSSGNPSPKIDKTTDNSASAAIANNREISMEAKKTQLDNAIAAGATKDNVANAISNAVANGTISKSEAAELRETYTPRGYTY